MTGDALITDWRIIERALVDFFQREGPHPQLVTPGMSLEPHIGDWIIKHGNKPILLSALARELAFELGERPAPARQEVLEL